MDNTERRERRPKYAVATLIVLAVATVIALSCVPRLVMPLGLARRTVHTDLIPMVHAMVTMALLILCLMTLGMTWVLDQSNVRRLGFATAGVLAMFTNLAHITITYHTDPVSLPFDWVLEPLSRVVPRHFEILFWPFMVLGPMMIWLAIFVALARIAEHIFGARRAADR